MTDGSVVSYRLRGDLIEVLVDSLFCKTVPKSYLSQIACTKFFLDTLQYTTSIRFHRCNRRHWSDRRQRRDRHRSGTNVVLEFILDVEIELQFG
jgi:hypothetical protein